LIRQLEADRMLPEQRHRLAILPLTANAYDSDRQRCAAAGMDGHLSKPIDRRALLAAVAKHASASAPPRLQAAIQSPPQVALGGSKAAPHNGAPPAAQRHESVIDADCHTNDHSETAGFNLDELLSRCLNDVELARRVLRKFQDQLPGQMEAIARRLATRCWPDAGRMAHTLVGSASNLALGALAQCAASLESACRDGNGPATKAIWAQMQEQAGWCLTLNADDIHRETSCKS
jgi:HPt (histidine-containing phosphotransfer) domain-containing protein